MFHYTVLYTDPETAEKVQENCFYFPALNRLFIREQKGFQKPIDYCTNHEEKIDEARKVLAGESPADSHWKTYSRAVEIGGCETAMEEFLELEPRLKRSLIASIDTLMQVVEQHHREIQ